MRGDRFRENPPLGAPWLTPQLEARLRDIERKHIRQRCWRYGPKDRLLVCEDAPEEAYKFVRDASGLKVEIVHGVVLYPGPPAGWPNADPAKLKRPYFHWWMVLEDGTIVDVASSQFGQRSPLVIPSTHPMQRLYVPEDPEADELPSGYVPLVLTPRRRNSYRMWHGTPYGPIRSFSDFSGSRAYFTPSVAVAKDYTKPLLASGRRPKNVTSSTPSIYEVEVDVKPDEIFDTRRPEHRALYEEIRQEIKRRFPNDPDEWIDRDLVRSVGDAGRTWWGDFPGFGTGLALEPYLRERGFAGLFLSEGSQGTSLLVFDKPSERTKIVREVDLKEVAGHSAWNPGAYYHGSKTPLKIGTIIRPKADGYVQQQYADGSEDNWVERAIEKGRPKDKLSRLESVFMLKLDESELQQPDLPDTFDQVGGYGEHIYEVEPLGRVERSDMKNYTMAAYPELFFDKDLKRYRAMAVEEYWSGDDADGVFEYRTPAARVVRRVGGSKGKG